jgi:hypothetical protein
MTTDGVVGATGWFVDTISITDGVSCCAPPPPYIQWIRFDLGMVTLQWTAIPGRTYRVQHKPSIEALSWIDLPGEVTAKTTSAMQTDSPGVDDQRFYRVVEVR